MPVRVHVRDVFSKKNNAAFGGPEEAVAELQQHTLTHSGGPKQDACFARSNGEGDVFEDQRAIKGEKDSGKREHGFGRILGRRTTERMDREGTHIHEAKTLSRSLVMKKSTKMIRTEAVTTA
jgi:hypothetical protein